VLFLTFAAATVVKPLRFIDALRSTNRKHDGKGLSRPKGSKLSYAPARTQGSSKTSSKNARNVAPSVASRTTIRPTVRSARRPSNSFILPMHRALLGCDATTKIDF
jgi:hypothetical protein